MKIRLPAGVRVDGRAVGGRSMDIESVIDRTDDTGRAVLLEIALKQLERADREELKAQHALERLAVRATPVMVREREAALSEAGLLVDDWSNVVDRITEHFEASEAEAERVHLRERAERGESRDFEDELDDYANEWEFSCEYVSGESSSNVDVNFRIRRIDGGQFNADEARRAMNTFRENLSAGRESAPRGYRIAGIDWRNPAKSTDWQGSGDFPSDLGGLSAPLYVASDHPSLWRLGGVDD